MMEHADGPAVLKRLSTRLVRDYAARCAARADVLDQEGAANGEWSMHAEEVYCSVVPEGTLAKARDGSQWTLMMVWNKQYGSRVLAQGSREHVERCAVDVAIHGPSGGPEFGDQRPGWYCTGNDDTLHAVTIGGELRLMPLISGDQLLMLARNDASVSVLDVGEAEALQRTAHERVLRAPGEALFVRIGEQRVFLRDIGAAGVLGQVDLFDGTRLVLGHLGGDYYGLIVVRDGQLGEYVGMYCFAELRRGDLGQILTWNHRTRGTQDRPADPAVGREAQVIPTTPQSESAPPPSPPLLLTCRKLSVTDLALIDRHLTFDPSGPGATIVPTLLQALRALARLELANRVMRGCDLRRLIKTLCKIEIHCCAKTFNRALAAIAAHMRAASPQPAVCLLSPVGKRWLLRWGDLQLVDSELLEWIARTTPAEAGTTATPPATSVHAPEPSAPDPAPSTSGPSSPVEPPRYRAPAASTEASSPRPRTEATSPDPPDPQQAHATPPDAALTFDDAEFARSLAEAQRRRRPWQMDGQFRATMGQLPDEESASRWSGRKKARDPPDEPE